MTHSPLPWRIDGAGIYTGISSANGESIISRYDCCLNEEGDAKLAVRAVNAHAALVAALEAIVARSQTDELGTSKVIDMRNLALAALKLARGDA